MYPDLAMPSHTAKRFVEWEANQWSGAVSRQSNHLGTKPNITKSASICVGCCRVSPRDLAPNMPFTIAFNRDYLPNKGYQTNQQRAPDLCDPTFQPITGNTPFLAPKSAVTVNFLNQIWPKFDLKSWQNTKLVPGLSWSVELRQDPSEAIGCKTEAGANWSWTMKVKECDSRQKGFLNSFFWGTRADALPCSFVHRLGLCHAGWSTITARGASAPAHATHACCTLLLYYRLGPCQAGGSTITARGNTTYRNSSWFDAVSIDCEFEFKIHTH